MTDIEPEIILCQALTAALNEYLNARHPITGAGLDRAEVERVEAMKPDICSAIVHIACGTVELMDIAQPGIGVGHCAYVDWWAVPSAWDAAITTSDDFERAISGGLTDSRESLNPADPKGVAPQ